MRPTCAATAIPSDPGGYDKVTGRERQFIEYFYRRGTLRPDALTTADIDEYTRTYAAGGLVASFNYY